MRIYGKYLFRGRRKAIGSIIGGAFILLILLSGYSFYLFSNRSVNVFQQVLSDMRVFDVDRSQELITFLGPPIPVGDNNHLQIMIKNNGPKTIKIIYNGVFDKTPLMDGLSEIHNYTKMDIYLAPAEEANITVFYQSFDGTVDDPYLYKIQFITERGNVFETKYPNRVEESNDEQLAMDIIAKVIGYAVPIYNTFYYADFKGYGIQYSLVDWKRGFSDIPSSNVIFRINVTYYGYSILTLDGDPTVGSKIHLISTSSANIEKAILLYKVSSANYNNEVFFPYGGTNLQQLSVRNQTYTLYFKLDQTVNKPQYGSFIILNDITHSYGQSIPFFNLNFK